MSAAKLTPWQNELIARALTDRLRDQHAFNACANEPAPLATQLRELPQVRAALTREFVALNRTTRLEPESRRRSEATSARPIRRRTPGKKA